MQQYPTSESSVSLQLTFTIFDYGKISSNKQAALASSIAASSENEYKENKAKTQKRLSLMALASAKAKLNSAIAALEATTTAYDYTKKRFDANLIGYTEYLAELTKKQDALYRASSAKNDVEIKKAELAFALGTDLLTLI